MVRITASLTALVTALAVVPAAEANGQYCNSGAISQLEADKRDPQGCGSVSGYSFSSPTTSPSIVQIKKMCDNRKCKALLQPLIRSVQTDCDWSAGNSFKLKSGLLDPVDNYCWGAAPSPSTSAPRTPAPSSPAPTTPAPRAPVPSTPAPTTPGRRTPAPSPEVTTPAPRTPVPSTPAPTTPGRRTPAPSPEVTTPATTEPCTIPPPPEPTPAPTTPAPTTPAPTTSAPVTPAPTTSAPKPPVPTTPAPSTSTPKTPCPPKTTSPNPDQHQTNPVPTTPAPAPSTPKTPCPPKTTSPNPDQHQTNPAPATSAPSNPDQHQTKPVPTTSAPSNPDQHQTKPTSAPSNPDQHQTKPTSVPLVSGTPCGNEKDGVKKCIDGEYCQPWNPWYYQCRTIDSTCGVQHVNVDFYGDDISNLSLSLPELCCVECHKTPGCKAYTFVNHNADGKPRCYLKKGTGKRQALVGAVSAKVESAACASSGAQCGSAATGASCCPKGEYCQPWNPWYYQCRPASHKCKAPEVGVDFYGDDIKTVFGLLPSDCCDLCAGTKGCKAYTFVNYNADGRSACYLKKGTGKKQPLAGAVSAERK